MIRILLVDDHPVVLDGLEAILSTQDDFEVVAMAASGAQALEVLAAQTPDVVLMDLQMPGMDGVETIRRARELSPDLRVIVFTAYDTDENILEALRAGARGYLLKGAPRAEVFSAIRVVHGGGSLLEPSIALRLLEDARAPVRAEVTLSPRETQVLELVAAGLLNKEIAVDLGISERTVKFHVSGLMNKLGAGNRTEAVAIAAGAGILVL
jgi:DNA-binding NarL/FixJ family response regulator